MHTYTRIPNFGKRHLWLRGQLLWPTVDNQSFDECHHCWFVRERQFNVDLGEFRLAVRLASLVSVATGNLIVSVKAGHHEQLLELLRTLGQAEKFSRLSGWNQEFSRASGRAAEQRWRFHLDEAVLVFEEPPHLGHELGTHMQIVPHLPSSQIQIPVPESVGLVGILGGRVDRDWQLRPASVQHFHHLHPHLNLTGPLTGQRSGDHGPFDPEHALQRNRAQLFKLAAFKQRLHTTVRVPEHQELVQTFPLQPAAQNDPLTDVVQRQLAASVRATSELVESFAGCRPRPSPQRHRRS
ncbi:hypothetical protein T4E_10077 [Trichinella pseudospiralis]|uniref:Uncharacterized protein n=1 Tax=Trichinella pseudospiralis TaxID=6337 RepID=A0A0V0XGI5_TRIPS|nr:hypothetical protein T4E_10077 [Trichinella pseudospiralis]